MTVQKWIGAPVKRREDPRLLTGKAAFIDDMQLPGMLYAAILRSPYAHAKIRMVNVSRALELPGVSAVITGQDVAKSLRPVPPFLEVPISEYPMAVNKVKYVGEPVAAVVAVDRATAQDALELIDVEYEPLPVVVDAEKAMKPGAPLLYEETGSNLILHLPLHYGDVEEAMREADIVVKERLKIHSYSSTPLEPLGCIANHDGASGVLTIWSNQQAPGLVFNAIAHALGIPGHNLRLIIPEIGGGFGIKTFMLRNYMILTGLLSMKVGRPVKWAENRREHLLAAGHSCEATYYVEAAVKRDGTLLGMKIKDIDNEGGGTLFLGYHLTNKLNNLTGPYRLKHVLLDGHCVVTNTCPSAPNRGIGKVGCCFLWERMMDIIAKKLELDPIEVRLKNYVQPHEFPYTTPSGNLLDSGNYHETLAKALESIEYRKLQEEQKRLRKQGRYIGVGVSAFTEPGGANMARHFVIAPHKLTRAGAHEGATVKLEMTGRVTVAVGTPCMGSGHDTVIAQIVADELGLDPEDVSKVPHYDSFTHPWTTYSGTWGNNFHLAGMGAVQGAARRLRDKILTIAAHLLEARKEDLEVGGGRVYVRGSPERGKTFTEIAGVAYGNVLALPPDTEPGLVATYFYSSPYANLPDEKRRVRSQLTHSFATHIALVEVDVETGMVQILRYLIAHDCGRIINPMIVEGQAHGNAHHGISAALGEGFVYDEGGQLLTGTFVDYIGLTAPDSPNIEVSHPVLCMSPVSPLGNKAVGEGAAIPSPAAIANAVEDALTPFGVQVRELPITPERVLKLIRETLKG